MTKIFVMLTLALFLAGCTFRVTTPSPPDIGYPKDHPEHVGEGYHPMPQRPYSW